MFLSSSLERSSIKERASDIELKAKISSSGSTVIQQPVSTSFHISPNCVDQDFDVTTAFVLLTLPKLSMDESTDNVFENGNINRKLILVRVNIIDEKER